jgi:deoxyribose-phosphate aldolase
MLSYLNFIKENQQNFQYNKIIDFTYLKIFSEESLKKFIQEAKLYSPYSVCILPGNIKLFKDELNGYPMKICTIIDYPKGDSDTNKKIKELNYAINQGADECDIVLNWKLFIKIEELLMQQDNQDNLLKNLLSNQEFVKNDIENKIYSLYKKLFNELSTLNHICSVNGIVSKLIIESGELTPNQIKILCLIINKIGFNYIVTSTGSAPNGIGAEINKVNIINHYKSKNTLIKVQGGIRSIKDITDYMSIGGERFGTSIKI